MQEKLNQVAQEDLSIILAELPATAKPSILPQPFWKVDEYVEFQGDTARVFQAYAKLIYFYLDFDIGFCQIRKYRYKRSTAQWDRFSSELKHIPEKYRNAVVTTDSVSSP